MTSTKKTKPAAADIADSAKDKVAGEAKTDMTAETGKSSLNTLLKEALANKNKQQQAQKNTNKVDAKGKKIGMPPRGTRRSMGKG